MKRQFWVALLSCLALAFSSIGFAACGGNNASEHSSESGQSGTTTGNEADIPVVIGTEGLEYEKIEGKDEYRLVGIGTATETDIVIASHVDGMPVTQIVDEAFHDCLSMTSITIPDSVTSIGTRLFWDCHNLTSATIGKGVTSISEYAFYKCNNLTSVTIISNNVRSIGLYAFYMCSSLKSITIGSSVTSIGNEAFRGCESLTSITFNGTQAQWYTIEKGSRWNEKVPATEVVCTDGTMNL